MAAYEDTPARERAFPTLTAYDQSVPDVFCPVGAVRLARLADITRVGDNGPGGVTDPADLEKNKDRRHADVRLLVEVWLGDRRRGPPYVRQRLV
jgi:hypothetical protein